MLVPCIYSLTFSGLVSASQTLALGASIVTVLIASNPLDICFLRSVPDTGTPGNSSFHLIACVATPRLAETFLDRFYAR
jgi:hypothetical protein